MSGAKAVCMGGLQSLRPAVSHTVYDDAKMRRLWQLQSIGEITLRERKIGDWGARGLSMDAGWEGSTTVRAQ